MKKTDFNNKNIYMWDSFKEKVYEKLPDTKLPTVKGQYVVIEKLMTDKEIIKTYNIIPFSLEECASIMLEKISKQPHGEHGELLTNGCSNVFYCKDADGFVFSAYACWDADDPKWDCGGSGLGSGWDAGRRFWSRNGDTSTLIPQTLGTSDTLSLIQNIIPVLTITINGKTEELVMKSEVLSALDETEI